MSNISTSHPFTFVYPGGVPKLYSDVAANDSDKTITVTAGKAWRLKSVWVEFTATVTVGNRILAILITTAANVVIWAGVRSGAIIATQVFNGGWQLYGLYNAGPRGGNSSLEGSLPDWVIPEGYKIRIYDVAAIDAAADDMSVHLLIDEIGVP